MNPIFKNGPSPQHRLLMVLCCSALLIFFFIGLCAHSRRKTCSPAALDIYYLCFVTLFVIITAVTYLISQILKSMAEANLHIAIMMFITIFAWLHLVALTSLSVCFVTVTAFYLHMVRTTIADCRLQIAD